MRISGAAILVSCFTALIATIIFLSIHQYHFAGPELVMSVIKTIFVYCLAYTCSAVLITLIIAIANGED